MFERLKGRVAPPPTAPASAAPKAAFARALADYPSHAPPHRGYARQLTPEQAQQNLDWFRQTLPERLAALRALAASTGLALHETPAGTLAQAQDLVTRLIAWTRACWPEVPYLPEHLDDAFWATSARTDDDAIFSLVLDVATLLGQTVMAGRPEWRWGLDLSRSSLGQQPKFSARRVVLTTPPLGGHGTPYLMDLEALVLERYRRPKDFRFNQTLEYDPWMEYVRDGYTGHVIDLMDGR